MSRPKQPDHDAWERTEPKRRNDSEVWGPILTGHLAGIDRVKRASETVLRDKLRRSKVDRWLVRLSGAGSWNAPQIEAACALWSIDGNTFWPYQWVRFFEYQLTPTGAGQERLGCFGGSEALSANYQKWLVGAVCHVRLWALTHKHERLTELSGAWLTRWAALTTLLASIEAPPGRARNQHGQRYDNGLWRCPVSPRSNDAHLDPEDRLQLTLALGRSLWSKRVDEWPVQAARALDHDFGIPESAELAMWDYLQDPLAVGAAEKVAALAAPCVIIPTITSLRWPGAWVVVLQARTNFNTPCQMCMSWAGDQFELCYPFMPGRAFKDKRKATAEWVPGEGYVRVVRDGEEFRVVAPREEPMMTVTMGPDSVTVRRTGHA